MSINNIIGPQIDAAKTQAFWDTSRLQQLKHNNDDPQSLKAAAQEFAALMFQMMIKSMRKAENSMKSELYSSEACKSYEEMLDQQWALHMAHSDYGKNSIVDTIVKQFTKNGSDSHCEHSEPIQRIGLDYAAVKAPCKDGGANEKQNRHCERSEAIQGTGLDCVAVKAPRKDEETNVPRYGVEVNVSQNEERGVLLPFTGPGDFIEKLLPSAIAVAKTIGVDPKLLLAQAALETGWGAKIAKLPDGASSYNLFGIKASHDWDGKKVATKTTEYSNGILQRKTDWFRAYDGFEDSMRDYVKLIGNEIRYQDSKASGNNPKIYTDALQKAGYATDPLYGKKIMQIYNEL